MKYVVGTTVELEIDSDDVTSLEQAKDILYEMLKNMGLDVGDMNGFEVPEEEEEYEE